MDSPVLKKRLSTFRTDGGRLTRVSDDLLIDILKGWESWTGTAKEFYESLGLSKMQLGGLIRKAKKLCREGNIAMGDFKEIKIDSQAATEGFGIELSWEKSRVIRFSQVDQLVDFLKKVA